MILHYTAATVNSTTPTYINTHVNFGDDHVLGHGSSSDQPEFSHGLDGRMTVSSSWQLGTAGAKGHGIGIENVQIVANGLANEKVQLESIRIYVGVSAGGIASSGNVDTGGIAANVGGRMIREGLGKLGADDIPGLFGTSRWKKTNEGHGSKSEFHVESLGGWK